MRALQPQGIEQCDHLAEHLLEDRPGALQRRRLAVPGEIDGQHVPVRCQPVEDCSPGLPAMPDAVQQNQRRTRPSTLEGQRHRKPLTRR
jgi:hypothetical protein